MENIEWILPNHGTHLDNGTRLIRIGLQDVHLLVFKSFNKCKSMVGIYIALLKYYNNIYACEHC